MEAKSDGTSEASQPQETSETSEATKEKMLESAKSESSTSAVTKSKNKSEKPSVTRVTLLSNPKAIKKEQKFLLIKNTSEPSQLPKTVTPVTPTPITPVNVTHRSSKLSVTPTVVKLSDLGSTTNINTSNLDNIVIVKQEQISTDPDWAPSSDIEEPKTTVVNVQEQPILTLLGQPVEEKVDESKRCRFCDQIFTSFQSLLKHQLITHDVKHEFKCTQCSFTANLPKDLRIHRETIHGQNPTKSNLEDSRKRKSQMNFPGVIKKFKEEHKHYRCDCYFEAYTKQAISNHIREKHIPVIVNKFEKELKCSMCEFTANTIKALSNHHLEEHVKDVKMLKEQKAEEKKEQESKKVEENISKLVDTRLVVFDILLMLLRHCVTLRSKLHYWDMNLRTNKTRTFKLKSFIFKQTIYF